ncbi:MAG: hypothetical protein B6U95_01140 [Thermofilum sp. ex4484_82]|nr:MAG: hypothetical protein B6U95_01140 [Thermofilum sp. ex4484_82]OYT39773.1 MAG: hypothetical protein B6U96_01145 [Archaeoglobales archaeon ex4484_92]
MRTSVLKPSLKMKTIYYAYLILFIVFYLMFSIPLTLLLLSVEGTLFFIIYWIEKYYNSITYEITDHEIIASQGVWWKTKSIVPFDKITNIDIVQGPISRYFNVATLRVQTAGYSTAQTVKKAEAELAYLENYEKIREDIMEKVRLRAKKEAAPSASGIESLVREVKEIRRLLEEYLKK